jgi:prophage regulatory protein
VIRGNYHLSEGLKLRDIGGRQILPGLRNRRMNRKLGDDWQSCEEAPASSIQTTSRQRILRLPEVCAVTGLGRSFIYQLQAAGSFPQRVKLGVRAVGWLEDEVQRWLSDKVSKDRQRNSVAD